MAIARNLKSTKLARVALNLGSGQVIQKYVPQSEAAQVENELISNLINSGFYRESWHHISGCPVRGVKSLFRIDGSPVSISWSPKGSRASAVFVVVWEARLTESTSEKSHLYKSYKRHKTCHSLDDVLIGYKWAVEFIVMHYRLGDKHRELLLGAYDDFLARHEITTSSF